VEDDEMKMKSSPKKILLTVIAIVTGLAMVHFWFTPGLRAIATWIVYRTEVPKMHKALEEDKLNNAKVTQTQSPTRRDLYGFAGDNSGAKP
jgi:hypothetical protein